MDQSSGPENCYHIRLKHAAEVRQTKRTIQIQTPQQTPFPSLLSSLEPSVYIYIQDFRGNYRIRIPVIPTRNRKVETPVETSFSRRIVDIYRGHWIDLQNRVIRRYIVLARQGIKSNRS